MENMNLVVDYISIDDDVYLEPYKDNAILVKIEKGGYVDLERFNSPLLLILPFQVSLFSIFTIPSST